MYTRVAALPKDVLAGGREVWLTSLGAVAVIEQQGERLVDTVVGQREELSRKGAQLEKRAKARLETAREDLAERGQQAMTKVGDLVAEPVGGTLRRLGVPTREEAQELSAKVDLLTRKLDTLIRALERAEGRPVAEHA